MNKQKYRVYYVNHDYYAAEEFASMAGAIIYGKERGFEFVVMYGNRSVAAWGPISGLRIYSKPQEHYKC